MSNDRLVQAIEENTRALRERDAPETTHINGRLYKSVAGGWRDPGRNVWELVTDAQEKS
jgi:hypothetical protein